VLGRVRGGAVRWDGETAAEGFRVLSSNYKVTRQSFSENKLATDHNFHFLTASHIYCFPKPESSHISCYRSSKLFAL
jgi:hypothetical protein